MDWWRSRRRGGAGLGLLALLVQIAVSFGHLHLQDLRGSGPTALPQVFQAGQPNTSRGQHSPALPDDDCPICVAVHMAAAGLVSVPPAIAVPTAFSRIVHTAPCVPDIAVARYVLFRTRAPPTA
jgi:hypothetical protein